MQEKKYVILNVKSFYVRFLSYGDLSVYDFFFKFSKDANFSSSFKS